MRPVEHIQQQGDNADEAFSVEPWCNQQCSDKSVLTSQETHIKGAVGKSYCLSLGIAIRQLLVKY